MTNIFPSLSFLILRQLLSFRHSYYKILNVRSLFTQNFELYLYRTMRNCIFTINRIILSKYRVFLWKMSLFFNQQKNIKTGIT